jgi:hypothetical protein
MAGDLHVDNFVLDLFEEGFRVDLGAQFLKVDDLESARSLASIIKSQIDLTKRTFSEHLSAAEG